jgi:spore germination cell wall hydrolase CwlJ-like protein
MAPGASPPKAVRAAPILKWPSLFSLRRTPRVPQGPKPRPARELAEEDRFCLEQAIYFEAGLEPIDGQRAVAEVVLNRVDDPRFPDSVCDVVQDAGKRRGGGCQFSWWCDGKSDKPREGARLDSARQVAAEVLSGAYVDRTNGALFFHNHMVKPPWSRKLKRVAVIGGHTFYR